MNWFKIKIRATSQGLEAQHFFGSSEENIESLAEKALRGGFIRLNDLRYMDGGEYKNWAEWPSIWRKKENPFVLINGGDIVYLMQFIDDPSLGTIQPVYDPSNVPITIGDL